MATIFEGYKQGGGTTGTPAGSTTTNTTPTVTSTTTRTYTSRTTPYPPQLEHQLERETSQDEIKEETVIIPPVNTNIPPKPPTVIITDTKNPLTPNLIIDINPVIKKTVEDKQVDPSVRLPQKTTSEHEKNIAEQQHDIRGPYTTSGKRKRAVQQLQRENKIEEGYSGITTYRDTKVSPLEYKTKYGYMPNQQVYYDILSDIKDNEDILLGNIDASRDAKRDIPYIEKQLSEGNTNLDSIRNAPDNAVIYITEYDESGKQIEKPYSKSEAITKYKDYLDILFINLQTNKELAGRETEYVNELKRIKSEKTSLGKYQEAGYVASYNEQGELVISVPKASDVVSKIYPEDKLQNLYTAQSMRSMGAETIGSIIHYDIVALTKGKTEADKIRSAEYERLSEGILGSTRNIGETGDEFRNRFWTSPEVISDIYLPVATIGMGAGLSIGGKALAGTRIGTAIISGASKSKTAITIGKALASKAGQVAIVGGIITVQEVPSIIGTYKTQPERLGSSIGRSAYNTGMNLAGFTVGVELGQSAYPLMHKGYVKANTVIRQKALSTNVKGELEHPGLAKIYNLREKIRYNITPEYRSIYAKPTLTEKISDRVTTVKTKVKTSLKEPDATSIKKDFESRGIPTKNNIVDSGNQPIKTFSEIRGDKKIIYDVESNRYTVQNIHNVGSTRPFTKDATKFKIPKRTTKTGYDIKTKHDLYNKDLVKQYNISTKGKTYQQKIDVYGKGKTNIIIEKQQDYFIPDKDFISVEKISGGTRVTKLENVESLKGTKQYGEWQGPRNKPMSAKDWKKWDTTKKDIIRYDKQKVDAHKKITNWKTKDTGNLKQYQLSGDTVVKVGGGKTKPMQTEILETGGKETRITVKDYYGKKWEQTQVENIIYGNAKPSLPSKPMDYGKLQGPAPKPANWKKWETTKKGVSKYEKQKELAGKKLSEVKPNKNILREYKLDGDTVIKTSSGKPRYVQDKLDITPYTTDGLIKEGTVAGVNRNIKPGSTPFKYSKSTDTPIKISNKSTGSSSPILEKKSSKPKTSSEYSGIETVDRPLTRTESRILYEAERATYPTGTISRIGRPTSILLIKPQHVKPERIQERGTRTSNWIKDRVDDKQIVGEIGGTRIGEIQEDKRKTERENDRRIIYDVKQDYDVETRQGQRQEMRQRQIQQQAQVTVTELKTRTIIPERVITRRKTKIPPPPIIRLDGDEGRAKRHREKHRLFGHRQKTSDKDKGLRADWLSVTQSQARYGKSTQPKLTKKVWYEAEKTGYKRVPTEELTKGGERKTFFGKNKRGII